MLFSLCPSVCLGVQRDTFSIKKLDNPKSLISEVATLAHYYRLLMSYDCDCQHWSALLPYLYSFSPDHPTLVVVVSPATRGVEAYARKCQEFLNYHQRTTVAYINLGGPVTLIGCCSPNFYQFYPSVRDFSEALDATPFFPVLPAPKIEITRIGCTAIHFKVKLVGLFRYLEWFGMEGEGTRPIFLVQTQNTTFAVDRLSAEENGVPLQAGKTYIFRVIATAPSGEKSPPTEIIVTTSPASEMYKILKSPHLKEKLEIMKKELTEAGGTILMCGRHGNGKSSYLSSVATIFSEDGKYNHAFGVGHGSILSYTKHFLRKQIIKPHWYGVDIPGLYDLDSDHECYLTKEKWLLLIDGCIKHDTFLLDERWTTGLQDFIPSNRVHVLFITVSYSSMLFDDMIEQITDILHWCHEYDRHGAKGLSALILITKADECAHIEPLDFIDDAEMMKQKKEFAKNIGGFPIDRIFFVANYKNGDSFVRSDVRDYILLSPLHAALAEIKAFVRDTEAIADPYHSIPSCCREVVPKKEGKEVERVPEQRNIGEDAIRAPEQRKEIIDPNWDCKEVSEFLATVPKLAPFAENLLELEIDGDLLFKMDRESMKEFGLTPGAIIVLKWLQKNTKKFLDERKGTL